MKNKFKLSMIIFLINVIYPFFSIEDNVFIINDGFTKSGLSEFVKIYEDSSKTFTIDKISNNNEIDFKHPETKSIYKKSYFWIKFGVINKSDNMEIILEHDNDIEMPMDLEVYVVDNMNEIEQQIGINQKFMHHNNIFQLKLLQNREYSVLINCPSTRYFSINFNIYEKNNFIKKIIIDQLFFGLLIGSLIILFFYNLFIFSSTRRYEFLFFNQFIFFYLLYQLIVFQYFFLFIPFFNQIKIHVYSIKVTFVIISSILFADNYLKIKIHAPLLRKLLFAVTAIIILLTVLIIIFDNIMIVNVRNVLFLFSILIMLIIACISAVKRHRPASFFLIASASFILFSAFNIVSSYVNILPSGSINLQNTGIIVMLFTFSLGLADYINILNKEKIGAQSLAIDNLHKADRLKDEFLANTSHELKTPLHCITSISESILNGDLDSKKDIYENIGLVLTSSKRLNSLIDDILDYSRMKYQDIILSKRNINIFSISDIAIKTLSAITQTKGLELINNIPAGIPVVFADENRVYQILYNLIGNAVKFTDKGRIEINAAIKTDHIEISVSDTGIGIKEKDAGRIFEPFVQADGSSERSYNGTGLGLSITKYLVELQDGNIWVKSAEGKGSTFYFTLPLSSEPGETKSTDIVKRTDEYKMNPHVENKNINNPDSSILIVDDDPINLKIVSNILSKENYRILTSFDGFDALSKLENNEIDLVLLDIMMPNLSGYDVCMKIREKYNLYEKPVILLTVKNEINDIIMGFDSGANDYLAKPFNNNEFKTRIRTLLKLKKMTQINDMLHKTNELKNQLLDFAAHDLRNPLSNMLISLDLIKKVVNKDLREYETLNSIFRSVNKMNMIIEELLENSFIEDGRVMLKKELINPDEIIINAIEAFREKAGRKNQKIIHKSGTENEYISADKIRFQEIIDNLLSNAVKYSHPGNITVETSKTLQNEREIILIKVIDNGPGFTDDDRSKLFNKFQKLSARPTGGEISTGLGLSITKKLVELHGWSIRLESEPNNGSTFVVELPLNLE